MGGTFSKEEMKHKMEPILIKLNKANITINDEK